jgi:hypothetical protein
MDESMNPPRELAFRVMDGIEVTLLWQADAGELTVTVIDPDHGHAFAVPVGDANALDVYHHPYWYAAMRAVDTGTGTCQGETAEAA